MNAYLYYEAYNKRTVATLLKMNEQAKFSTHKALFPWEDMLDTFGKSHNTYSADQYIANCSFPEGPVDNKSWLLNSSRKHQPVYDLPVGYPGAGKSPVFQHGCAHPIRLHVEAEEDIPLLVNEFPEAGTFRQLTVMHCHKATLGRGGIPVL